MGCWNRVFSVSSVFSLFCPISSCSPRPKFLWVSLEFLFCIPIPYDKKHNFFLVLVIEGIGASLIAQLVKNLAQLFFGVSHRRNWGFPDSSAGKESACSAGDPGSTHGSGRSTREWIGYPFQYSWASLDWDLTETLIMNSLLPNSD